MNVGNKDNGLDNDGDLEQQSAQHIQSGRFIFGHPVDVVAHKLLPEAALKSMNKPNVPAYVLE